MAPRLRALLVCLSFVFFLVQAQAARAQVAGPRLSAPESSAPVKLTLHPMTAGQQGKLFAAGLGGAVLGSAAALGTGALMGAVLYCSSCESDDDDGLGPNFGAFILGAAVAGATSLITVPLGAAIAEQAVGRRMGYRSRIGKSVGGALLGMGIAAGVDTGLVRLFADSHASPGVQIATCVTVGLAIVALSSSLFHRLERAHVQAVPTLAPTAQGGFTAGMAGRF
jgi:hypothetical protein